MGAGPDTLKHDAIAAAYRAFAVPTPASLGVCTDCCMDPALERAMLAKNPADLTPREVEEWLGAAFRDDMDGQQVSWIMPRILELLVEGQEFSATEVVLWRLRQAGFPQKWTADQASAVSAACQFALDDHVSAGRYGLDDLLCMIANSGLDISPFLARLDSLPDDALADLLHADWSWATDLQFCRSGFWDWEGVPGRQAVWDWYTSVGLETRMWQAGSAGNMRAIAVAECIAASPMEEPPI